MDEKKISDITLYTLKLIDQKISSDEFDELNSIISSDTQAARYYNQLMMTVYNFEEIGKELISDESAADNALQKEFWKSLGEYEKKAPRVQFHKQEPQRELIQKVVYPPRKRQKINKLSIFTFVNVAAVILLIVFLRFVPFRGGVEVATLTDSIDAKWAGNAASFEKGARMVTGNEKWLLREGYVELLFDTNARVVIEAPAEFQILADDRIGLNYGKIYSQVPKEAVGFSVYTRNSKIVDLGTEFGVEADLRGETQLHVIQGKTKLIAGEQSDTTSIEVGQGQAKKISGITSKISPISCESELFVRKIDSVVGLVWKGQKKISLADIVGGGDGFGTGRLNYGIMIDSGKLSTEPLFIGNYNIHYAATQGFFRLVSEVAAVDRIFVPDGGTGSVVISSQGHTFEGCPDTTSTWCVPIINGARYESDSDVQFQIDGQAYGTAENPGLFLHANIGITYDLNVIRRLFPAEKTLTRFSSVGSTLDTLSYGQPGLVDIWVLVDGQVRFSKTNAAPSETFNLDIPLTEEDRFLSLVVTDGINDISVGQRHKDGFDWVLFGMPELIIE